MSLPPSHDLPLEPSDADSRDHAPIANTPAAHQTAHGSHAADAPIGSDDLDEWLQNSDEPVSTSSPEPESAAEPVDMAVPGRLPTLIARESMWWKALFGLLAVALVVGFFVWTHQYWVPSNPGVDQNGYLVGGKMFAEHGSTRFSPINPDTHQVDPFMFVGRMWIGTDFGTSSERYYPKYPIGMPVIVAVLLKVGGAARGVVWSYYISPVCMTLALVAIFLLMRMIAGSFAAILGTLIVASSPVTLGLTNNPNSHASTLFCVCWGMFFLLRWWQKNGWWRAAAAGFLLGYAVTIRYSEAMLLFPLAALEWPKAWEAYTKASHYGIPAFKALRILPIGPMGLVILFNMRWRRLRSYLQSGLMLLCWALPVALLFWHNWVGFHSLTGYDPTNESTGFSWLNFCNNWETMLRQMYTLGLFFILPFGVLGLIVLLWRFTRLALVMWAWVIPSIALYTAYYWAPDNMNIGYMRFFLTVLPPLTLGAVWLLAYVLPAFGREAQAKIAAEHTPLLPPHPHRFKGSFPVAMVVGAILIVAINVLMNIYTAIDFLRMDHARDEAVNVAVDNVLKDAPPGSVIFGRDQTLHPLQFAGNYRLYTEQPFAPMRQPMRNDAADPNQPQPLQRERAEALDKRLREMNRPEPAKLERELVENAILNNHRVFEVYSGREAHLTANALSGEGRRFEEIEVSSWEQPPEPRPDFRGRPGGAGGGGFGGPGGGGIGNRGFRGFGNDGGRGAGRFNNNMDPLKWRLIELKLVASPRLPVIAPPPKAVTPSTRPATPTAMPAARLSATPGTPAMPPTGDAAANRANVTQTTKPPTH